MDIFELNMNTVRYKRRKSKRVLIIAIFAAVLILLFGTVYILSHSDVRDKGYNSAKILMQNKSYVKAAAAFKDLGKYRDSEELAKESKYEYANDLLKKGKFNEAIVIFKELGDYRGSAVVVNSTKDIDSKYITAQKLIKNGNSYEALSIFNSLGDYKDSEFYKTFILAPEAIHAEKVIKKVKGKNRIIYVAQEENNYGVAKGEFVGEYKKITKKGKTTYTIQFIPSKNISMGSGSERAVALTFDDGGEKLQHIINILDKKGVKATFFLVAKELTESPDVWRAAVKEGHQICNHTVSHDLGIANYSEEKIKKDILGWETVAKKVLGEDYVARMKRDFPFFRSPGGAMSTWLSQVLGNLGYSKTIFWSIEDIYFSSRNPGYSIVKHYIQETDNGSIMLFHGGDDIYISNIIDELRKKNYGIKLVSDILVKR